MLLTMPESYDLKVMRGNVGNDFSHVPSTEKACTVYGEEFSGRKGCVVEIIQILHGKATASRAFSLHLGDFMRSLGHVTSRSDSDIWMKKDDGHKECSCVSTRVDDFLIIGTNAEPIMKKLEEKFLIRTQEIDPKACLGLQ